MLKNPRRLESATAETSVHVSQTALIPTFNMIVRGTALSVMPVIAVPASDSELQFTRANYSDYEWQL